MVTILEIIHEILKRTASIKAWRATKSKDTFKMLQEVIRTSADASQSGHDIFNIAIAGCIDATSKANNTG